MERKEEKNAAMELKLKCGPVMAKMNLMMKLTFSAEHF